MGSGTWLRVVSGMKWVLLSESNNSVFSLGAPQDETLYNLAYPQGENTQLVFLTPGYDL